MTFKDVKFVKNKVINLILTWTTFQRCPLGRHVHLIPLKGIYPPRAIILFSYPWGIYMYIYTGRGSGDIIFEEFDFLQNIIFPNPIINIIEISRKV